MDRLSMALFDAAVDLNPHQIEASLFALQSPLSEGVILADEVGLGKTIEAGIVLCQLWAERRRRLLVICPASIRKQWALELEEKFNLPVRVLDAKGYRQARRSGQTPLATDAIVVISHHYANRLREELKAVAWDLVVIDEAHKLRNAYRPSNKVGQGIRWATEDSRKLLLTATPLQNSLLELYGLSTLIDERLFGDVNSFRSQYASAGSNLDALRQRLSVFCKRTLRNEGNGVHPVHGAAPDHAAIQADGQRTRVVRSRFQLCSAGRQLRTPQKAEASHGPDSAKTARLVVAGHCRHARHVESAS